MAEAIGLLSWCEKTIRFTSAKNAIEITKPKKRRAWSFMVLA